MILCAIFWKIILGTKALMCEGKKQKGQTTQSGGQQNWGHIHEQRGHGGERGGMVSSDKSRRKGDQEAQAGTGS